MTLQDNVLNTSVDSTTALQRLDNPLSVQALPLRSVSSFAIASGGSFTDNASSNFAGNLSNPFDDARIFANGAVTLNGTPLFSGFGNGLTLGPTGTLQNVSAAIGNSLKLGRVAEAIAIDIPAYVVPPIESFDRTIEAWRMPLNGAADVALAFGAGEIKTVRFTGGSLNLPSATVLKNLTIVVENGDVNFNGDRHLLENVRLIVLNGSVNLGGVQGQNLEVYAARSIHMNQAARFGGKSFLGTQNGDVIFNGSTVSSATANSLKVIANGNIYVNASVNAHASFLASGSFTANYDSSIVGSIRTQGGITFNAKVNISTEIQPLIGVIDTGFSGNNPDIDYSRILVGRDRIDNDNDPFIFPGIGSEHGTHIAGLIGATRDNGFGINGMNDQAPLWLGRAVGSGNWADSLIEFVDAAKQAGQPHAIANLSFDLTQRDASGRVTTRYELTPQERKALEYARQNGVLIVVPSGNDGGVASVLGQASQEFLNIITVGAIGSIDGTTPTGYSNRGRGLNIVAYGGDLSHPVLSTVGDGVGTMIGTSVAAASVTGAASKVWEANPTLNALQVKDILLKSAIDLGAPGWDVLTGNGRLNLDGAIALAQQTEAQPYNPVPYLIPITWGGEGKVTPIERPANVTDETVNLGRNPLSGIRGGTLTPVNFTDYFTFNLTNRQEVSLNFGPTGIISNTGLILSLHDTTGQSLGELKSRFVGPYLPIRKVLEPGEYFIKATADEFRVDSSSEYTIQLGLTEVKQDPQPQPDPGNGNSNPGTGVIPNPGGTNPGGEMPIPIVVSDLFNPTYQANKSKLGKPIANVTSLGDGITQQKFEKGVIVSSSKGTFVVDGSIWTEIVKRGGIKSALGVPLKESEDLDSGNRSQRFENGLLVVTNGSASVLKPSSLLDEYLKLGGPKGWLGIPKGNETDNGNGFLTQGFEHGYIVSNGQQTVAYEIGQGVSLQPFPNPSPELGLRKIIDLIENSIFRGVEGAKDFIVGALMGEFNDNPSLWQTLLDTAIGMIPIIGEVGDVRDLVAYTVKFTNTPDEKNDFWNWVGVAGASIGLIPVVGGAIKGVTKLARNADMVKELRKLGPVITNTTVDFVRKNDWQVLSRQSVNLFDKYLEVVENIINKLNESILALKNLLPLQFQLVSRNFPDRDFLNSIAVRVRELRREASTKINEGFSFIENKLVRANEPIRSSDYLNNSNWPDLFADAKIPESERSFFVKSLEHIFYGGIRNGKSEGFHYENDSLKANKSYVVDSTRTINDMHGVYQAKVFIQGKSKNSPSSFFPRAWTEIDVMKSVYEARKNGSYTTDLPDLEGSRWWIGESKGGVKIKISIAQDGSINTAFPLYGGK